MPNPVIVDTDILIDTAHSISEAVACLEQVEQNASLAISAITEMELIIGCRNRPLIGHPLSDEERMLYATQRQVTKRAANSAASRADPVNNITLRQRR